MKTRILSLCLLCAFAAFSAIGAETAPPEVAGVLTRMDQAAPNFHGISADVTLTEYNKLLDDKTNQSGTLQMQRAPGGVVRAILAFPAEQTLAFMGKELQIYYPKTGELQKYKASDLGSALNQFLLLGFGSSGRELQRNYTITADGTDKINGQSTLKLVLVPKDKAVAEKLRKAELWVPGDSAYPVQQQFWDSTSGNYRLLTYSNIKINPPIQGNLEFKAPSDAKKKRK